MARMTLEEKLAAVMKLGREPITEQTTTALLGWLEDGQNIVAAQAAEIMGHSGNDAFIPPLTTQFLRLVSHPQPASVDKLCRAKEAMILALDALRCADATPYLLGIRHVQMEPVFAGQRADTAPSLRAHCATALARKRDADAYFALTALLVDPETQPRLAAIKGLAYLAGEKSELLLRLKLLTGDADADVLSEAMSALLLLEPQRTLPFLADFLQAGDRQTAELAALALGNSRLPEAFPVLCAQWERNSDLTARRYLLLAMALTRSEEAFSYLLDILRHDAETTALHACDALALYGVDRRYRERIAAVVAARKNPRISDAFCSLFPPGP